MPNVSVALKPGKFKSCPAPCGVQFIPTNNRQQYHFPSCRKRAEYKRLRKATVTDAIIGTRGSRDCTNCKASKVGKRFAWQGDNRVEVLCYKCFRKFNRQRAYEAPRFAGYEALADILMFEQQLADHDSEIEPGLSIWPVEKLGLTVGPSAWLEEARKLPPSDEPCYLYCRRCEFRLCKVKNGAVIQDRELTILVVKECVGCPRCSVGNRIVWTPLKDAIPHGSAPIPSPPRPKPWTDGRYVEVQLDQGMTRAEAAVWLF